MGSILTLDNRVFRAIEFKNSNLYLAIGRTTPWASPASPPDPVNTITQVEELIYIKKLIEKRLVKQDSAGEIDIDGTLYTEITESNAYTENAYSVYLSTTIYYTDISSSISYRQIGVIADPVKNSVVLTGSDYLASEIDSQGILHFIENRVKVERDDSQSEKIMFLIDF